MPSRFYDSNRRCYHPVGAEVEVMNKPLVVFLVAFALVTVAPWVAAQDFCDKQFVVSQVDLRTTTHLSPSELAAIRARLIAICFDDHQLGELAVIVRDTLLGLGYLRATVSQTDITIADASRHPQAASVNVGFEEGARYKVREIEWSGFSALSSDQLKSISQIQIEDVLFMSKVRETAEAARKLYIANGYLKASVVPQVRVGVGQGATVIFRVVEGARSPSSNGN
jgi:Surface antigen variable number repeat